VIRAWQLARIGRGGEPARRLDRSGEVTFEGGGGEGDIFVRVRRDELVQDRGLLRVRWSGRGKTDREQDHPEKGRATVVPAHDRVNLPSFGGHLVRF
jgi:hypothetical protein